MIIGMSGFARSGKDAAAEYFVKKHGFTRLAFADTLRDFLYALNPYVIDATGYEHTTLKSVIDTEGWANYKEGYYGNEIRRLLQRLGTEAGRDVLWDTIWIDATLKDLDPDGNYVISDARFLNEFAAIENLGGHILRVERPGVGPANDHPSEMEALQHDFKYLVHNKGDLAYYYRRLDWFLKMFNTPQGEWIQIPEGVEA